MKNEKNCKIDCRKILYDLVETVLEEFCIDNDTELISDLNKINRKGIFVKSEPIPKFNESLLTKILRNKLVFIPKNDYYYIESLNENDPDYYYMVVIIPFLKQELRIVASKKSIINDVLKRVYDICIEKCLNKNEMPYMTSEGYEFRLVDDGTPIFEINPLDKTKQLKEYDLDVIAFCPDRKSVV